jgi:hypothetical protein
MRGHTKALQTILALALSLALQAGSSLAQTTATSTDKDQKDLAITVYNSNVALVRDVRRLKLPAGTFNLRYMDIAAQVNPATVHIVSLIAPHELSVLEQNYEYDLLSPEKLLQKYVGKELTLIRTVEENNSTKEIPVKATLLADNNGPVWQVGDQIITGMGADRYVFPDLPENLYSKPTLVWLLQNERAGEQTVEASYLTNNVNWNADYVLQIGSDQKNADLIGWVTIVNGSGTSFKNAQLQLVAGQLNRVTEPSGGAMMEMRAMKTMAAPAPQFAQENISEYHLYTLDRRTTVANNETKQISLLDAPGVKVEKVFEVNGQQYFYHNSMRPGQSIKEPVQVFIKFKNSEQNSLGVPLPAGTVRVYQNDSKGRVQFIGEDRIDHTPKDETLDLHIGDAFDVVAERKQTDYQSLGHAFEMAFEIALRNHKSEPITVLVNEPIGGDWTMLESNFKYDKTEAFGARFTVPVAANGDATVKYRIRVRW